MTKKITKVKTPELEKLKTVCDKSQEIGMFLEWLGSKKKIDLMKWNESCAEPSPVHATTEQLLAEYFKINLKKAEEERQALLDNLRQNNAR